MYPGRCAASATPRHLGVVADAAPAVSPHDRKGADHDRTPTVDFEALKARQQTTWSSANYAVIGSTLQLAGEALCETVDVAAGERVLDVATGNGNAALAAARRGAEVTASDWVAALLDETRARAEADGLAVAVRVADAEALPFADAAYDVVLSTFGITYAPQQEQVAAELARVCKPGGRIGLANWTPESFIGQVFKTIGKYLPPPPGVRSPALWGTKARLEELFGKSAHEIRTTRRDFTFRYRSPMHWIDVFRTYYGPLNKTYGALDPEKQAQFTRDLMLLLESRNRSRDRTLVLQSEYLEVVIDRK
jgi:ubiquinone/menaquinone biosynthesis C-methylase UbiE